MPVLVADHPYSSKEYKGEYYYQNSSDIHRHPFMTYKINDAHIRLKKTSSDKVDVSIQ